MEQHNGGRLTATPSHTYTVTCPNCSASVPIPVERFHGIRAYTRWVLRVTGAILLTLAAVTSVAVFANLAWTWIR